MPSSTRAARSVAWLSPALLIIGSIIFVAGGAQHPRAATAFGPVGSDEFWRSFATHITHQPNWIGIHVLILLGPILWALGLPRRTGEDAASVGLAHGGAAVQLDLLAGRSLLLGATLWSIAFVIDGFVAVQTAGSIVSASATDLPGFLAVFRFHQNVMLRLGLIAWILIGLSMTLSGTSLIVRARVVGSRSFVGALGVVIGLWPVVAALNGEFDPGPFTSSLWNVTALASAFWFAAFGVSLGVRERGAVAATRRASPDLSLQE